MPTTSSSGTKREPFHFVFANPGSEKDRKRENQLARSHTARVNRENRLPTRSGSHSSVPPQPKRLAQRVPAQAADDGGRGAGEFAVSNDGRPVRRAGGSQQWQEIRLNEEPSTSTTCASSSHEDDESMSFALVPKPRSIAPVIGAQSSATFQLGTTPAELERAAQYCLKVIWPNLLMDSAANKSWWDAFREQPVIFHGFHFALTVHHDVMVNKADWSISRAGLMHKMRTIRLLNQILSNLTDDNIEWAILAVLVLASNELKPDRVITAGVSMFEPHMPEANWNQVYARMEQVPEHGRAMYILIQQRGGLKEIRLPGLAAVLAFSDILSASYGLRRPAFPIFWQEELGDLLLAQHNFFATGTIDINSGRGFRRKVPSGLPQDTCLVFTNLSIIDQIMEQCRGRQLPVEQKWTVVSVRNSAHHRLLSLPSWEELDEVDQTIHDRTSYECCRLTGLLYSNAVIFPIPPHSGYPSLLLEQILALLTPQVLAEWEQEDSPLLIWILVIGGIASYGSPQRGSFEKSLRRTLRARNYPSPKTYVRTAAKAFLWTDSACGPGFDELWNALALELVGVS